MSYTDPRWQKLRLEVMSRDNWSCVACGSKDKELHVHHIRYGKQLWDVEAADLQTLCFECHDALGEHPKGGVWWSKHDDGGVGFSVSHCPTCGGNNWRDKGSYDACNDCGYRTVPKHWPWEQL